MGNLAIDFNHKATLASSNMPTSVESLNFNKLKFKLTSGKEATMSKKVCEFAEQEYKRFLALKYFYPKETLVPNKLVDEFWHAHILDTRNYHMDCLKIFGVCKKFCFEEFGLKILVLKTISSHTHAFLFLNFNALS